MFICNFKVNGKKIWKTTIIVLVILICALMFLVIWKIINSSKNPHNYEDNNLIEITSDLYTSFLQDCHENIDNYIGKNIKITGYVYRLPDFTNNEFVVARTMIIDKNNQAVVVGILSQNSDANKYETGSWIEVTGTIIKGNYNGEIPILNIENIKSVKCPDDEFVYM